MRFRHEQGGRAGKFVLLPEAISKEPLGAMVRKGDDAWFDLVRWTHLAQVAEEELGVISANADRMLASTDLAVCRLLGADGRRRQEHRGRPAGPTGSSSRSALRRDVRA